MANGTMYFRVVARNFKTGKEQEVISPTTGQACFAAFALRGMNKDLRVHELDWHFEKNDGEKAGDGASVEEVTELVNHFFPEDQRNGMTVEFLGQSEQHPDREVVRFSNMGGYPRNLFMGKIFTIRNLNRYPESYLFFKKMKATGVPTRYAAVLGATIQHQMGFGGAFSIVFRGYARTMNPSSHTVADMRNAANNKIVGEIGANWGDTGEDNYGGYNVKRYDGVEASTHRQGYTNSKTLQNTVGSNMAKPGISWEGLMKLVSSITGKKPWLNAVEPYQGPNAPK